MSASFRRCAQGFALTLSMLAAGYVFAQTSTTVPVQVLPADAPDPVPLLDSLLADLHTLRTDVRQLIVENTGGVLEESQILFMLKRPHGFYWETLDPFPELIVTDGTTLWNYQPDLLQLTIESWNADRSELAARLLSGNTEAIADEYAVEVFPVNRTDYEFILTPRDPASLYEQVSLFFEQGDATETQLASILLISTNGQRTYWEFLNRQINPALEDSVFRFQIPDDDMLDIVDKRETDKL
jgi:outer membrane lipoprotein carrier protein